MNNRYVKINLLYKSVLISFLFYNIMCMFVNINELVKKFLNFFSEKLKSLVNYFFTINFYAFSIGIFLQTLTGLQFRRVLITYFVRI